MPQLVPVIAAYLTASLGATLATIVANIVVSPVSDMAPIDFGTVDNLLRRKRIEPFERQRGHMHHTFFARAKGGCMGDLVPHGSILVLHKTGTIKAGDLITIAMGKKHWMTKRFMWAEHDGVAIEVDEPKRRQALCFDEYITAVYRVSQVIRPAGGWRDAARFVGDLYAAWRSIVKQAYAEKLGQYAAGGTHGRLAP